MDNLAQIVVSLERAAGATYCRLAAEMKKLHNTTAVGVFEHLDEVARGHAREVSDWAGDLGFTIASANDETGAIERDEARAARDLMLTPWQALNMAVHNEQAAFEYLSQVAAEARRDDVRRQAETFASKKLEHIALLRLERKNAWHTDARARLDAVVGREIPATLKNFEETTARLLSALCDRYLELAGEAEAAGDDVSTALLRQIAVSVDSSADAPPLPAGEANADIADILRTAMRETEAAFDAFMAVAERAAEEDIIDAAQRRAGERVDDLKRLRDRLAENIF